MYLEVNNISKYFDKKPILKNLSFSLQKGEILSFVGDSGAGKTTFLNCLSGLDKIESGKIVLDGIVLNNESNFVEPQKRDVGLVFQDYPLFPHLNLKQNILFNLKGFDQVEFDRLIEVSKLDSLLEKYPHQLSGGEKQRASIVRAILRKPKLLLLDEPFNNLDKNIKSQIINEILQTIKKYEITTILVTHDTNNLFHYSDKILIFKAATLQQFDSPVNTYCNPSNCYCAELMGDLNKVIIDNITYYLRPENVKLVKKSKYPVVINASVFNKSIYKIKGKLFDNDLMFNSSKHLDAGETIYIDFNQKDLINFKKECEGYFEN
ncbi:MAG: hypothetical protein CMC82_06305 [Flavobacteriaceae bacterium]|nr:hypothetical protein [Flavobacteriaceae bacterium]|tara:strand:+ start:803 stop:1765 length:963 start_codon:yes stop_codon:yes gene_type:complete